MDRVVVLDYGSQYTQLIARRIREFHVYCEIYPFDLTLEELRAKRPKALILSGGPASVFAPGAPQVSRDLFELGIPVLGICYGMQGMAKALGAQVERSDRHEYGRARVQVEHNSGPWSAFTVGEELEVWMSHGDQVRSLPEGFITVAQNSSTPNVAIAHGEKQLYGIQFHPEVVHTPRGADLIRGFLFDVARCSPDWTAGSFVQDSVERIREQVGDGRAVCGLSGGVDSSVAAMLVWKAIGDRLTCVFVDNGFLRQGEAHSVVSTFREGLGLPLVVCDAEERFVSALQGVEDPEEKRKIIGREFVTVFDAQADAIGDVDFLVQGTLYPDVIESVSSRGPAAVIKSHHNVGGLPERMRLRLVEPLRDLFKDEVRAVGEELGIPRDILYRHPFPGPGLAIRCLGAVQGDRLTILRHADKIFLDELRSAGLYDKVWQAFAVLIPVRTVGVMGDERSYEYVIALRAVEAVDGMTADWAHLPHEFLSQVSTRIINEVRGCNRVVYDVSSKPPATIEWE